jgi:hypothetical protein
MSKGKEFNMIMEVYHRFPRIRKICYFPISGVINGFLGVSIEQEPFNDKTP